MKTEREEFEKEEWVRTLMWLVPIPAGSHPEIGTRTRVDGEECVRCKCRGDALNAMRMGAWAVAITPGGDVVRVMRRAALESERDADWAAAVRDAMEAGDFGHIAAAAVARFRAERNLVMFWPRLDDRPGYRIVVEQPPKPPPRVWQPRRVRPGVQMTGYPRLEDVRPPLTAEEIASIRF